MKRLDAIETRLAKYQAAIVIPYADRGYKEFVAIGPFERHAADDIQWLLTKVRELQRKQHNHTPADAGKDSPATQPASTLSEAEEESQMPLAGHGNNHSSDSLKEGASN